MSRRARRPYPRHRVFSLLVALVLVAAACGRSGGDSASSSTAREAAAMSTSTSAVPTTTAPPTTLPLAPTTAPPTTLEPPPLPPSGPAAALLTPAGVLVTVLEDRGTEWLVRTPCFGTAVLTAGWPIAAGGVVVLDPGHGGDEPGAVGPNGLAEKDLNLMVANEVEARLESAGVPTVLTRNADYRITLKARGELAVALGARAFVSIHHNAEPDGPWPGPGSETYHQIGSDESRRLSGLVYEELVAAFAPYDIDWVADRDAGAKYRPSDEGGDFYGILRNSAGVPAVLSEAAFLSSPPEAELLATPEFRAVEAQALTDAVLRFLQTPDPGSGFVEPYPRPNPSGSTGGPEGCEDPPFG